MAASQDETYRDAKNLHSKYMRHQAFEAEIAANKDRLQRVQEVGSTCLFVCLFVATQISIPGLLTGYVRLPGSPVYCGQKMTSQNKSHLLR
jgi:hypothetical protein